MNYYNEWDKKTAAWLRELIKEGLIADGIVDERSITDVSPEDVRGFTQCHWFAGIGGWSYALRLAGWPDDRPVWTASLPCQPFSNAGKQKGIQDDRHLWPVFRRLVHECAPPVLFGEQVASKLVVGGASCEDEDVQTMQDRKAVFRVLRELEGKSWEMQGMRKGNGAASQEKEQEWNIQSTQGLERCQARLCSCQCCQALGEETRTGIQSGARGYSETDRLWQMRIDGDTIQSLYAKSLERSIFGPEEFSAWLHEGQCASGIVCPKCNGEHMGGWEDFGDCAGDFDEASFGIKRLLRELGTSSHEEAWADRLLLDLEEEGYSCGKAILGAFSVGAPHKRKRLYWGGVANNQRKGGEGLEQRSDTCIIGQWDWGGQEDLQFIANSPVERGRVWPKPIICSMDDGLSSRVASLHGYGNAIVPQCAAQFISAFVEAVQDQSHASLPHQLQPEPAPDQPCPRAQSGEAGGTIRP